MPPVSTTWTQTPAAPTTSWSTANPSPAHQDGCEYRQAHDGGQNWTISAVSELICRIQFPIEDLDSGTGWTQSP